MDDTTAPLSPSIDHLTTPVPSTFPNARHYPPSVDIDETRASGLRTARQPEFLRSSDEGGCATTHQDAALDAAILELDIEAMELRLRLTEARRKLLILQARRPILPSQDLPRVLRATTAPTAPALGAELPRVVLTTPTAPTTAAPTAPALEAELPHVVLTTPTAPTTSTAPTALTPTAIERTGVAPSWGDALLHHTARLHVQTADDRAWITAATAAPATSREADAKRMAFIHVLVEAPDATIPLTSWAALLDAAATYYTLHGHLPPNLFGSTWAGTSLFSSKAVSILIADHTFEPVLNLPPTEQTRGILLYALGQAQSGPEADAWQALHDAPRFEPPSVASPAYRRPPIHAALATVLAGWRKAVRLLPPRLVADRAYDVLAHFCEKFDRVDGLRDLLLRQFLIKKAAAAQDPSLIAEGATWRTLHEYVVTIATTDSPIYAPGTTREAFSSAAELDRIRFAFYKTAVDYGHRKTAESAAGGHYYHRDNDSKHTDKRVTLGNEQRDDVRDPPGRRTVCRLHLAGRCTFGEACKHRHEDTTDAKSVRAGSLSACRAFAATGRCRYGDKCYNSHDSGAPTSRDTTKHDSTKRDTNTGDHTTKRDSTKRDTNTGDARNFHRTRRVAAMPRDIMDVGQDDVLQKSATGRTHQMSLHCTVNGLPTTAVLDSGATTTVIPENLVKESIDFPFVGGRPELYPHDATNTGYDGSTHKTTQGVVIRLRFFVSAGFGRNGVTSCSEHLEREFDVRAIVDPQATEFLIGCNALFDGGPMQELHHLATDPSLTFLTSTRYAASIPPEIDEHGCSTTAARTRRLGSVLDTAEPDADSDSESDADSDSGSDDGGTDVHARHHVRRVDGAPSSSPAMVHRVDHSADSEPPTFEQLANDAVARNPHVSEAGRRKMIDLLIRNREIFVASKAELPQTLPSTSPVVPFSVKLKDPGVLPPRVSRCHYDPSKYELASAAIADLVSGGVIAKAPRGTPAYSAAHLVRQRGKSRLTIDARNLNAATTRDATYNDAIERNMHTLLHDLHGCNAFSEMDLAAAFTGLPIADDSKDLLVMMTHDGPYYILRATYGAADVPAAFQHEYRRVFDAANADELQQRTALFVDDSLTAAHIGADDEGLDNHIELHQRLFSQLATRGWRLNILKCRFLATEGRFCGVVTDGTTIRPDATRVAELLAMPAPLTFADLRRLVGLVNWWQPRIPNSDYIDTRSALETLLRKGVTASGRVSTSMLGPSWTPALDAGFERLKEHVASSVLLLPDSSLPLYLRCDASADGGCGAVVLQFDRTTGKPMPLAYFAALWRDNQRQWPPGRKEAYTCFLAVTKWAARYARGMPVVLLESDANNLTSTTDPLGNIASKDRQIAQWWTTMLAYPYTSLRALRQPGATNSAADLLSRPSERTRRAGVHDITPVAGHRYTTPLMEKIVRAQQASTEPLPASTTTTEFQHIGRVHFLHGAVLVPAAATEERAEILKLAHDMAGHTGERRTLAAIHRSHVTWVGLSDEVAQFVASCVDCQFNKTRTSLPQLGASAPTIAPHPWHTLYLDPFGPLPAPAKGYVFVVVDALTRFLWLIYRQHSTAQDATAVLSDLIRARGDSPRVLRVDSAQALVGTVLRKWADERSIDVARSPPYAHHTLGLAESKNAVFTAMAKVLHGDRAPLALTDQRQLDVVASHINAAYSRELGTSPHYAMYGKHPTNALARALGEADDAHGHDYANRLAQVHSYIATALSASTLADAATRDRNRLPPPTYFVGQLVLLWHPTVSKWSNTYRGPYVINAVIDASWYKVHKLVYDDPTTAPTITVSVARLKAFNDTRTTTDALLARTLDEDFAIVSEILEHRRRPDGALEFAIKWHNGDVSWTTADEGQLHRIAKFVSYLQRHDIATPTHRDSAEPTDAEAAPRVPRPRPGRPPKPGSVAFQRQLAEDAAADAVRLTNHAVATSTGTITDTTRVRFESSAKQHSHHRVMPANDPAGYARRTRAMKAAARQSIAAELASAPTPTPTNETTKNEKRGRGVSDLVTRRSPRLHT